jgi:hypothetical protein
MRLHGGAVPGKDVGQAGRIGRCRTLPVRRGDGDGGDGGASYAGKTTRLTGGAGLPVREAREREGLAGGAGLSARAGEGSVRAASRASRPANGPRGGGGNARARGRGGGRDMGQNWPSRGSSFPFSFYFL